MRYVKPSDLRLKKRKRTAHKGDNGRALVIGGSEEYVGAVALAGLAALRSGCDWVTVAAPSKVAWAINCLTPDLVTVKLTGKMIRPNHMAILRRLIMKHDVVLLGNGAGTSRQTKRLIHLVIKECNRIPKMMVIDADALKTIKIDEPKIALMTPHAGEMKSLLENSRLGRMPDSIKDWGIIQKRLGQRVIVLKGPTDIIANGHWIWANKTHHPSMTVAGTGDVLAGLCAGFLAQGYPIFTSAVNATYLNGLTGLGIATRKKPTGLLASDLVRDIRSVLTALRKKKRIILK